MELIKQYLFNLVTLLSIALNTLLGGYPKEMLSERSGRAHRAKGKFWLRDVINFLFFWDEDHCEQTLLGEDTKEIWDWEK